MLGSITPNFRAISLVATESSVALHFLLEQDRPNDRDEIEDIVFEFEALQLSNIAVKVQVGASDQPIADLALPGRRIYLEKSSLVWKELRDVRVE